MKPIKAKIDLPVNELGEVAYIGTNIIFERNGERVQDRVDGYIQKPGTSTLIPHCQRTGATPSIWTYPIKDSFALKLSSKPAIEFPLDCNGNLIYPDCFIGYDEGFTGVFRLLLSDDMTYWIADATYSIIRLDPGVNKDVTVIPTE